MSKEYIKALQGVVALPCMMSGTITELAVGIRVLLEDEQKKANPDNHMIHLLCESARMGYEYLTYVKPVAMWEKGR